MSPAVVIEGLDGIRTISDNDFPLSIGGPGSDIRVPGVPVDETAAFIAIDDGALFVQPAHSDCHVMMSGIPITTSTWFHPGDRLEVGNASIAIHTDETPVRLLVSSRAEDSPTQPPQATIPSHEPPTEESITVIPIEYSPDRNRRDGAWSPDGPRRWSWLAGFLLIVVCTGLWYLLTARSVAFQIDPQPDQLTVSGGLAPKVGNRYLLLPGDYVVRAELADHHALSHTITVSREARQVFEFGLEPLPGLVTISSGDIKGAAIEIDGTIVGATPMADIELPMGAHEVVIRADRHQVHSETLIISEPGQKNSLDVELVPAWAAISITSDPSGATVLIDGNQSDRHRLLRKSEAAPTDSRSASRLPDREAPSAGRGRRTPGIPRHSPRSGHGATPCHELPLRSNGHGGWSIRRSDPRRSRPWARLRPQIKIAKAAHEPQATTVTIAAGASEHLEVTSGAPLRRGGDPQSPQAGLKSLSTARPAAIPASDFACPQWLIPSRFARTASRPFPPPSSPRPACWRPLTSR